MRNFKKPAARTASSRTRNAIRGVSAVVASFALAVGLGTYPVEVSAQESVSPVETEPAETEQAVTVKREKNVDHITVKDPQGYVWDFGFKASLEDVFAIKRVGKGEIKEIRKVTIDGHEIEPEFYGFVNADKNNDKEADEQESYLAFDIQALYSVPPRLVEFEVETTDEAEYSVAEADEVPSKKELKESGFGMKASETIAEESTESEADTNAPEEADALELSPESTNGGRLRAAQPGPVYGQPGVYDQELSLSNPQPKFLNGNPELGMTVNETGEWRMTRFAIKKDRNDSNTKSITGPVRIRVVRNGTTVVDRTFEDLYEKEWNWNSLNKSYDTEFQLIPKVTDLYFQGGDIIIFNPVAPPNGTYAVQIWGQDMDNESQGHRVNVTGNGVELSEQKTEGEDPYKTTFTVKENSLFENAHLTLSPSARLEDVYFELPIEGLGDGVTLEHEVKTYSDRVEITWFPTKDGQRLSSVKVAKDSQVVLRTSYRSEPTRSEDLVINGSRDKDWVIEPEPGLPIAPIEEKDVPPVTPSGEKCTQRDTKPDSRQPARSLTASEALYGTRRFVVASPNSSKDRISSQLYLQVQDETGNYKTHEVGPKSGWVYNAIAYNDKDNYIYAISEPRTVDSVGHIEDPCFPAGHLLQINPYTGEVFDLGRVQGFLGELPEHASKVGEYSNDLGSGINAGTFDSNGKYWVAASSSWGAGRLYEVDLDRLTATSKNKFPAKQAAATPWSIGQNYRTVSEDIVALSDAPNYAWGIQSGWANPSTPQKIWLERINLSTGKVDRIDITNLTMPSGQTLFGFLGNPNKAPVWGQGWAESGDTLAFGLGGSSSKGGVSQIVEIKVGNAAASIGSVKPRIVGTRTAPSSYNTDGTSAIAPDTVPEPVDPLVEKDAVEDHAIANGDGTYNLKYTITVTNPDKNMGAIYDEVVDKPEFPNSVKILKTSWTKTDEFGRKAGSGIQQGAGPFKLAGYAEIQPAGTKQFGQTSNGKHVFEVEMQVAIDANAAAPKTGECKPGQGFFNTAIVGNKEDDGCVPYPEEGTDTVRLHLAKISSDDLNKENVLAEAEKLKTAEFELRTLDNEGNETGVATKLTLNQETGTFSSEELKPGHYRLVETKAPESYSLLTKPIDFRVSVSGQGKDVKADITFDDPEGIELIAQEVDYSKAPSQWNLSSKDVVMTVANVFQGDLPKTGGVGLWVPTLVGLTIIGLGVLLATRRRQLS